MKWLSILIFVIYAIDVILLCLFAFHTYLMLWLYSRNPAACERKKSAHKPLPKNRLPLVSIQLPVYNEYYVIDRLLEAVAKIRWPKSKLEILVLDDSTDDTKEKIAGLVSQMKARGFRIRHIHRKDRKGHKAGALQNALELSKAEFIAIFDADFVPDPDFLHDCMPAFFSDPDIGMVQTRWGHINADYSALTRAQAIGIDGHFILEQVARNANRLWMNFNGTAGIWRRQCILDAGNWQTDTLTEDFDLSYRAELAGWKFQYYMDVISPAELPSTLTSFKSQQFRWCKGSIQTALKLLGRILRADFSWKIKAEAFTHLLNYSVHPLMLINILLLLPVLLLEPCLPLPQAGLSERLIVALMLLLGFASAAPSIFYAYSQYKLYPDWLRRILWLPALMILGTGIAVNNTRAYLEALFKVRSPFVRTPKLRIESRKDRLESRKRYRQRSDVFSWIEILVGLYSLGMCYVAYIQGRSLVIPFLVLYALGFLYIGAGSIAESLKNKKEQV